MCQILLSNTAVLSSAGGNATEIKLTGTVSSCDFVKFILNPAVGAPIVVIAPVSQGNWNITVDGTFPCGQLFKVDAICVNQDGTVQGNCTMNTFSVTPNCQTDKCCLVPVITYVPGACNANDERLVTFTVNYNVADPACLPYAVQLNYGDGDFGGNHTITVTGAGSFTETHYYNATVSNTFNVTLSDILHSDCTPETTQVNIISCVNGPCCPQIDTPVITFGDCDNNCKRKVIITTPIIVGAGANCVPVILQWDFGNGFASPTQSFIAAGSYSYIVSEYFDPGAAPISATLTVVYPLNCPSTKAIEISNIPPCDSQLPPCPDIQELSAVVGDCNADGKREVTITAQIQTFGSSCSSAVDMIINYGTGDSDSESFQGSGTQTVHWTYYYTPSATPYTIQLETIIPTNCVSKAIQVSIPDCPVINSNDTSQTPSLCPCCILIFITVITYYLLWALGYYAGNLTVMNVNLGAKLGYSTSIFALLIGLIIFFCYKQVDSCKKCWDCRFWTCMFYALLISLIILIVVLIVDLIYGIPVAPLILPFSFVIPALLTAWLFSDTARCKNFFDNGTCQ